MRDGVFNTVSMLTTTGFASSDFAPWPALALLVMFGILLCGRRRGRRAAPSS